MEAKELSSALYEGRVTHHRHGPHPHSFSYRMAQLFLDLDELETVFRGRWLWSTRRPALAEWRRTDYLAPHDRPLAQVVRERVAQVTGRAPDGPIRLLTHPRYAGYVFNPVSFYYCYQADRLTLDCIVAEITNTPWRERHTYVLPTVDAKCAGGSLTWTFAKSFHVSPFMPMERSYAWSFTPPGEDLNVRMRVLAGAHADFDATLVLQRRSLDGHGLARLLWRYPLMTVQVIAAIHWQALCLWVKKNPVYNHPQRSGADLDTPNSAR